VVDLFHGSATRLSEASTSAPSCGEQVEEYH
jgi:hypothetical protein